jgi:DNA-binding MarR family transcriptional regulator
VQTPWLDDTEQRAWRAFLRVHSQVMGRLARQLQEDSDLSLADYDVLVRLTESAAPTLRPSELAERLQWEQSRLSHQLSRMERRGLVWRHDHPSDGRGLVIEATERGWQAIRSAAPGHAEAVRRLFFDGVPAAEVEPLARLLEDVLRKLSETDD